MVTEPHLLEPYYLNAEDAQSFELLLQGEGWEALLVQPYDLFTVVAASQ